MTDYRQRRRQFAEEHSGFHVGQRVCLSARGRVAVRRRHPHRTAEDLGTIVDLPTCMTARVQWDRCKQAAPISVEFIAPAEALSYPTQQRGDQP